VRRPDEGRGIVGFDRLAHPIELQWRVGQVGLDQLPNKADVISGARHQLGQDPLIDDMKVRLGHWTLPSTWLPSEADAARSCRPMLARAPTPRPARRGESAC